MCVSVCAQKRDNTHLHTHPKAGVTLRSQQRCSRAAGHAGAPWSASPTPKTHASKHKNNAPKLSHRPPCKYKLCKPCKRGGLCASVDLKGWEWVNSTMTASGEPASSGTCTNPSLSLCLSLDLSRRRRGEVKGKLFLWFHA